MAKTNMLGVIFDEGSKQKTPVVDSDAADFYIPFDKAEDFFAMYENEINFYRGVEKLVRTDDYYKRYIRYLIEVVGMDCCQVMPNVKVEDKSKVTFEMHHGPILTLFDITLIICNWYRYHNQEITTFDVADRILEEHHLDRVRVVLVNKTIHEQIHEDNIILNYQSGYGNTHAFLQAYREGVTPDIQRRINKYIEWSKAHDSYDNDILEIATTLRRWEYNDWDTFQSKDLRHIDRNEVEGVKGSEED